MKYNERFVYVMQDFSDSLASNVIKLLFELDAKPKSDIVMLINSSGGDISAMTAIHDAMKMLRNDVATVCIGNAYSSAAVILAAGTKGKRFITPYSEVMLHEPSSKASGKYSEMMDEMKTLQFSDQIIKNILAKNVKVSVDEILIARTDKYFTAEEAVTVGLADHIVTSIDEVIKATAKSKQT